MTINNTTVVDGRAMKPTSSDVSKVAIVMADTAMSAFETFIPGASQSRDVSMLSLAYCEPRVPGTNLVVLSSRARPSLPSCCRPQPEMGVCSRVLVLLHEPRWRLRSPALGLEASLILQARRRGARPLSWLRVGRLFGV